jgi:pyridoxal phosphate enzyme (YggS family)
MIKKFPVTERVERVQALIADAIARSGRGAEEVSLVAVTKGVDRDRILLARDGGLRIFGENRVQEAESKIPGFPDDCSWHMVGHLQRNKVKEALDLFDLIQSVDSRRLAREISKRSAERGGETRVLVQVKTTGEETKFGVGAEELPELLDTVEELGNVRVSGLMTIGPFTDDEREIRKSFRLLRAVFDRISGIDYRNIAMQDLSMGMTDDFEIAIEEGATMVRIGRAIFGPRAASGH